MKASIEWLKEYTDIEVSAKELADILTLTGSKVEDILSQGEDIKNVVVGKILEINKHPDADKLVVTKVDVGDAIIQIVTGATNVKEGDIVPIAKDGAKLPGEKKIKTGVLRGIESCGMMCSIGELGLTKDRYPDQIEEGIMILPKEYEKQLGKEIVEVLKLKEDVIDFEITPNRPDCLSIEGLGRETAASLRKPFFNPRSDLEKLKVEKKDQIEGLKVEITAEDLCYRYAARMVKNVTIGKSPDWMVRRLQACGVRSINNIVDITNYVMLELGQPMHAFDIESIKGKKITVRRAKKGEKITTLDEVERVLEDTMLVIADEEKPVAIAGVMGGLNSEIEQNTDTVVFESAVFYGGSIRKTAKKVGLRTEASSRYEKGLSPENAIRVVNRAVQLVEQLGIGEAVEGVIDVYPTKQRENRIPFEVEKINQLLGTKISKEEMISILERLEIKVEKEQVIPPYYRQDIEGVADLAEEVLRFYGYDKLESTLIYAESTCGGKNKTQKIQDKMCQLLVGRGLCEIYTYGFLNEKELDKINLEDDSILRKESILIQNPLSEDYTMMRATTIPSMMQVLSTNYNKKNKEVSLFDLSRIYQNDTSQIEGGKLPKEEVVLTIGMYGQTKDFYTLKGILENLLEVAGVSKYLIQKEEVNRQYHPGRTANIWVGKDCIATFGQIHPLIAENYGISTPVWLAQLNVEKVVKYARENKKYVPIAKYPAVQRDIAVVVEEEMEVGKIEEIIEKKAKKALESLTLFDVYRNDKVGNNKKSVAYSLTFRNKEKTMTEEEINQIMKGIIQELEIKLGAELRK